MKHKLLHACDVIISDASQVLEKFRKVTPDTTYGQADVSLTDCGICMLTSTTVLEDVVDKYIDEAGIELTGGGYIFPTLHHIGCEREQWMWARFQLKIGDNAYNTAIRPRIKLLEAIIHETVKVQEQINNGKFKINDSCVLV
jgi:hypothetical protein